MTKYKRLTSDTGFARNLPINEELYDRLYELENAIENGTLIELPCKVGDTVWYTEKNVNGLTIYGKVAIIKYRWELDVNQENKILQTQFYARCPAVFQNGIKWDKVIFGFYFDEAEIGERVFLTEAEAREKLEELRK